MKTGTLFARMVASLLERNFLYTWGTRTTLHSCFDPTCLGFSFLQYYYTSIATLVGTVCLNIQ